MFYVKSVALNLAIYIRARRTYIIFQHLITGTIHFEQTVGYETTKQGTQQPNRIEERQRKTKKRVNNKTANRRHCIKIPFLFKQYNIF